MGRLEGKVALITGAAGGFGRAAARLFAGEGASLYLTDREDESLSACLSEQGGGAIGTAGDVADPVFAKRMVAEAESRLGGLDIAVLNAGIAGPVAPLVDYPLEAFDAVMRVNVRGVWLGLQNVIPALRRRGGGSIVVTSSLAGVVGVPKIAPYVASKHALVGLVRAAALECARDNIRINSVNPAPAETAMGEALVRGYGADDPVAARTRMERLNPSRRFASAEDVAHTMLFLASEDSRYCTGGVYMVDGGFSAG